MKTIRLTLENKRTTAMLVFIEPEAMDFWLQAGEQCQLVALAEEREEVHFEIQYTDEGVVVFPSPGCGSISVFQKETELECGHQRPASWS